MRAAKRKMGAVASKVNLSGILGWLAAFPHIPPNRKKDYLNEINARQLLLVRAVESADTEEVVLRRDERQYATRTALAQTAATPNAQASHEKFLASRAALLFDRLKERYPQVEQACNAARWPAWLSWSLPVVAFALGLVTNELSTDRRVNIIAFPFLGMLAWNVIVYVVLIIGALRPNRGAHARPSFIDPVVQLIKRPTQSLKVAPDTSEPLPRGLSRFAVDWLYFSTPLAVHRTRGTLHLSAALFAIGILLGMYVRALGLEYRAGWESTFIDEYILHRVLSIVLGPASAITGIAIPDPVELRIIRWSATQPGDNAARWIHLYATTALVFIVVPRGAMWVWHAVRANRLRSDFALPLEADPYLRRLLMTLRGQGTVVRVLPYSYHASERVRQNLQTLLAAILSEKSQVDIAPAIPYGGEDDYLASDALDDDQQAEHVVVLFNIAATPEKENHGALVDGLQNSKRQGKAVPQITILLDESAYRQKLARQGGAEERLRSRREAWQAMLNNHDARILFADLESGDPSATAKLLETAVMHHLPA
jgi:hypothetical protein